MPTLITGVVIVIVLYIVLQMFCAANPAVLARAVKIAGGIACLAIAAFIGLKGELALAIPFCLFGTGLLGWPLALESYLDRRFPGWRQDTQSERTGRQRGQAPSSKMTAEEAYQILGLKPGAARDEIGRAHRALMKKLHPDQGGSTYLAARINEAKQTLLHTHYS